MQALFDRSNQLTERTRPAFGTHSHPRSPLGANLNEVNNDDSCIITVLPYGRWTLSTCSCILQDRLVYQRSVSVKRSPPSIFWFFTLRTLRPTYVVATQKLMSLLKRYKNQLPSVSSSNRFRATVLFVANGRRVSVFPCSIQPVPLCWYFFCLKQSSRTVSVSTLVDCAKVLEAARALVPISRDRSSQYSYIGLFVLHVFIPLNYRFALGNYAKAAERVFNQNFRATGSGLS